MYRPKHILPDPNGHIFSSLLSLIYLRLQYELSCLWVLGNVGGETDSTGSLPRCVLTAGDQVVHILQQLGFTGSRVSTQQDVHLRPTVQEHHDIVSQEYSKGTPDTVSEST